MHSWTTKWKNYLYKNGVWFFPILTTNYMNNLSQGTKLRLKKSKALRSEPKDRFFFQCRVHDSRTKKSHQLHTWIGITRCRLTINKVEKKNNNQCLLKKWKYILNATELLVQNYNPCHNTFNLHMIKKGFSIEKEHLLQTSNVTLYRYQIHHLYCIILIMLGSIILQ